MGFLRRVLTVFAEQRRIHGMQSLSMIEVATLASNGVVPARRAERVSPEWEPVR
jgi:hypothetical protein